MLVGYPNVIIDYATFAYLTDVYISAADQGIGLSKWLMKTIFSRPDLQNLRRILLVTKDVQGLYQQFNLKPLTLTSTFMDFWQPNIY